MWIRLDIPKTEEHALRGAWGRDLERAVLEAITIEGYRTGRFGAATVGRLLGHDSRWKTEQWLAGRSIPLNYTVDDLEADRKTLSRLLRRTD